jgi:hypothetical protein
VKPQHQQPGEDGWMQQHEAQQPEAPSSTVPWVPLLW